MGVAVVVVALGVPALAFVLWPLLRSSHTRARFLPVPPDAREHLLERKRQLLRALHEIDFEHDAGHVSDEDFAALRARYESETADVLTELDRLGRPAGQPVMPAPAPHPPRPRAWRHPLALGGGALALLVFGIAIGAGVVRHTAPDPTAGMSPPGSRPLASLDAPAPGGSSLSPAMLRGMLDAARASLAQGRYGEAIAAYQAVLKRDPKNVEAMTHLGLIVALGGHADAALETFDRALAIDPSYPPALLYQGQVLYEAKRDTAGAVRSWEKFLAVVPTGEDHERVKGLIAEARARK
jgi:cytochrome c-type biogenesis protein CcmH/NrfG